MTREWVWQPQPLNIWVGIRPYGRLQSYVLQSLQEKLETEGCVFVETPGERTQFGRVPHLGIGFGAYLDQEINPREVYGKLPKPRGIVLMITVADGIPDGDGLFDLARGQMVKKASHIFALVDGDPDRMAVRKALWGSMAGNYCLLKGDEEDIFGSLALRILVHAGAEPINRHEGDEETWLSWKQWSNSPVHRDIAYAGRELGRAGIIEDEVSLGRYGSQGQVRRVLRFLNRAALGEGMRSQLDPALRVMGVTTTGGGKINVSAEPRDGHVVPIAQLTPKGYIRVIPRGCPTGFRFPSVETHENGLVYLAGALVNAGLVDGFDSFLNYLAEHFAQHDRIDILPDGMSPKVSVIEHFHRQPKEGTIKDTASVEIVYPDKTRFPAVDFPCGVREAELLLLSALFQSKSFSEPGPLDKVVVAVLPGHGSVAIYGGCRQELISTLVDGMKMEEVARV